MKRISPSKKMKQEAEEVFTEWETKGHPLDSFTKFGNRLATVKSYRRTLPLTISSDV